MKKIILLAIVLMIAMGAVAANAAVYTFTPGDKDLADLDHNNFYSWGINWTHSSETITGATLKIFNIWDWVNERNDSLYIHLLNNVNPSNPNPSVVIGTDNEGGGDHFVGTPRIGTFTDLQGGAQHNPKLNLTYDLGALGLLPTLQTYVSDDANHRFGFGFDPDCHYYNDSIQVCITTGTPPPSVPEPSVLSMLGLGLSGIALYLRKKK
jgi:hypothetical protein